MLDGELRRQKALFAATDSVALVAALDAAWRLRDPFVAWSSDLAAMAAATIVILLVWMLAARAFGLYHLSKRGLAEIVGVAKASSATLLTVLIWCFLTHQEPSRLAVGSAFVLSVVFVACSRIATRRCIRRLYANPAIAIPVVIVGYKSILRKYVRDRTVEELSQYRVPGKASSTTVGLRTATTAAPKYLAVWRRFLPWRLLIAISRQP